MKPIGFLHGFLLFTAFGLMLFVYKYLDFLTRETPVRWFVPFLEEMTGAYALGLTAPLILWMTRRVPIRWPGPMTWLPKHLAAALGLSFVQTTLIHGLRLAVFGLLGLGVYDYGIMRIRYFMEMPVELMNYAVVAGFAVYRARELRLVELERELAAAQLDKLRLQLQPHFLFNTLNMISSVVYESPRKADEMLCRLSHYLRESLERDPAQEVELAEEIRSLRAYLDIMQARFEEGLHVHWEVDESLDRAVVPHFLLQPLAENSFRHGVDASTGRVKLSVRTHRQGDLLLIEIADSGTGAASPERGLGLGLGNTRKRLQHLYGDRGVVSLSASDSRGTTVLVSLPYKEVECSPS